MDLSFGFFLSAAGFGIALAMDAFSVSLANGLAEPTMRKRRMCLIAGIFAAFQALMPMIGWVIIHTLVNTFSSLEKAIPWIALLLLSYIGGKMIYEGVTHKEDEGDAPRACTLPTLLVQGVATSIDALSVGLDIADYKLPSAALTAGIIAVLTFCICMAGLFIGRKAGTKLAGKAGIFGGVILIAIGLEIFITSWF